jgi:diguanylate cyclase (GGDEF)-like protein
MALMKKVDPGEWLAAVDKKVGGGAVAMAMTDIDNFASVNSEHGHEAGDKALASWERTLTGSLPKEAIVGRLGGDEYAVVLPDYSAESALILFDEIRSHFANHPVVTGTRWRLDASAGIAARPPHAAETVDLLRAAHDALARAKREGRGRVAIYVEEKMVLKSNYYTRATLDRLAKLSTVTGRTEASLLREGLDDLLAKYRDEL